MSEDEATSTVVSLLGPGTEPAGTLTVPDTGAVLALYAVREGRLYHVVSADSGDEFGARMIALGKSHRRGILARLFRAGERP